MKKIIYILTNEAMPKHIKIGITDNLVQRLNSLDRTNLPLPFICYHASIVDDAEKVERAILNSFIDKRVRNNREFLEIEPEKILPILLLVEKENATPKNEYLNATEEEIQEIESIRKRRENFNFDMVNIKVGEELVFLPAEEIKAIVKDNKNILVNNELCTLSGFASKYLGYRVAGPLYWSYRGIILEDLRNKVEDGESLNSIFSN